MDLTFENVIKIATQPILTPNQFIKLLKSDKKFLQVLKDDRFCEQMLIHYYPMFHRTTVANNNYFLNKIERLMRKELGNNTAFSKFYLAMIFRNRYYSTLTDEEDIKNLTTRLSLPITVDGYYIVYIVEHYYIVSTIGLGLQQWNHTIIDLLTNQPILKEKTEGNLWEEPHFLVSKHYIIQYRRSQSTTTIRKIFKSLDGIKYKDFYVGSFLELKQVDLIITTDYNDGFYICDIPSSEFYHLSKSRLEEKTFSVQKFKLFKLSSFLVLPNGKLIDVSVQGERESGFIIPTNNYENNEPAINIKKSSSVYNILKAVDVWTIIERYQNVFMYQMPLIVRKNSYSLPPIIHEKSFYGVKIGNGTVTIFERFFPINEKNVLFTSELLLCETCLNEPMYRCECGEVKYCSKDCQESHWGLHQDTCTKVN